MVGTGANFYTYDPETDRLSSIRGYFDVFCAPANRWKGDPKPRVDRRGDVAVRPSRGSMLESNEGDRAICAVSSMRGTAAASAVTP